MASFPSRLPLCVIDRMHGSKVTYAVKKSKATAWERLFLRSVNLIRGVVKG